MLQRGWSDFVSSKKFLAEDAIIFSRGDNNELRVVVRRAMSHRGIVPFSFIFSHNMRFGVLESARHSYLKGEAFTVFYRPRMSPAQFIVPFKQYMDSVNRDYYIGMRFAMRLEGEEAQEQRFHGTLVGVEAVDPERRPVCLSLNGGVSR